MYRSERIEKRNSRIFLDYNYFTTAKQRNCRYFCTNLILERSWQQPILSRKSLSLEEERRRSTTEEDEEDEEEKKKARVRNVTRSR